MKLFITLLGASLNQVFLFFMVMASIFAGAAWVNKAMEDDLEVPMIVQNPDIFLWGTIILALAGFVAHIIGQKLWWSKGYEGGKLVPVTLMFSGIPLCLLFLGFTYLIFPK